MVLGQQSTIPYYYAGHNKWCPMYLHITEHDFGKPKFWFAINLVGLVLEPNKPNRSSFAHLIWFEIEVYALQLLYLCLKLVWNILLRITILLALGSTLLHGNKAGSNPSLYLYRQVMWRRGWSLRTSLAVRLCWSFSHTSSLAGCFCPSSFHESAISIFYP